MKPTPGKTAVIVVDMQRDYCDKNGALGKIGMSLTQIQSMIPQMKKFLNHARSQGVLVVHTQMTEDPASLAQNVQRKQAASFGSNWKMCTPGTWGYELIMTPEEYEPVFAKNTYDVFSNLALKKYLDSLDITSVIFVGVNAHVCVESSIRSAVTLGYDVFIVTDLVGSPDHLQQVKECSLLTLTSLFAYDLKSSEFFSDSSHPSQNVLD